jgi:hypothetical protein
MSDSITIFNGGEAPQAAGAVANTGAAATGAVAPGLDQSDVMQFNGGQAPHPASTAQEKAAAVAETSSGAAAEPPLGGGVHA